MRSAYRPPSRPRSGRRSRGLSERARRLGWGAAVAGEPFDIDLAAAAAGLSEQEALAAIDDLLTANVAGPTDVARRYRFRHPLVRRAVYDGAGEAWRLQAHARAAAALADRPGALAARAHHVERSARVGDEAAAAVLEQAGHQAAARAPAVAARWFEAALRLLDAPACEYSPAPARPRPPPRSIPLASSPCSCRSSAALAATGRLERALEALVAALALVDLPDLRVRLIAACAACENLLGRHEAAHARLRHALEALEDQDGAAAAALHAELAADALFHSDFGAMREWAAHAAEAARRLSDRGLEALATALLCFAEYNLGNPEPAEAARVHAAELIDALPDDQLMMRLDAPYYFGFAEYFCEHYEDSIRHFRRGINLSRTIGLGQFVVTTGVGLAHALEVRGRLAEAAETADAAVESARLSGNRQLVGFALVADAWTAASLGDSERARAAGDEAVAVLDGLDDSVLTRGTHAHLGVMWADLGEYDRCLRRSARSGCRSSRRSSRTPRLDLAALARTDLARGDREAAQAWADRSERVLKGLGLPFADAWLVHARAASRWTRATPRARCGSRSRRSSAARPSRRRSPPRAAARSPVLRWPPRGGGRTPSASSRAPRRSCRRSAPPATATRRRASCAGSASASPPASAGAAARGSTRCRAASARSLSGSPRGAPTARSAPSCSCPRRPSRATSPASSRSSAWPPGSRSPRS